MPTGDSKSALVFICWSGGRSLAIAHRLCDLLGRVLPELDGRVFVSTQIEKGARWFDEIERRLDSARAGILCLTPENVDSPWLHFEAGALARQLEEPVEGEGAATRERQRRSRRIFTYAHGVPAGALRGPLSQYQSAATTREDTLGLFSSLVDVLALERRAEVAAVFEREWPGFERDLGNVQLSVPTLIPEFERWFRRKTFDEPVQECADQNWIGRYDGARQTHDRLTAHVASVRHACPPYQVDLFEHLIGVVESYAMTMRGLLLGADPFRLGSDGALQIDAGIREACEKRRRQVKTIVSRILDPVAVPATTEAACFWVTDSFAHRKVMVHRLEHAILGGRQRGGEGLPKAGELDRLFRSTWDLDRIHGYLAVEHVHAGEPGIVARLNGAVRMELETVNAERERRSLMALHYALGALHQALALAAHDGLATRDERAAATSVCADTKELIERSRRAPDDEPELDSGGHVRRTIRNIEAVANLGAETPPSPASSRARETIVPRAPEGARVKT